MEVRALPSLCIVYQREKDVHIHAFGVWHFNYVGHFQFKHLAAHQFSLVMSVRTSLPTCYTPPSPPLSGNGEEKEMCKGATDRNM